MSITTKRTIYGNQLQTAKFSGARHVVMPHSSLNEKFGILEGVQPEQNPELGYFVIGIGGHQMVAGGDGTYLTKPRYHRARDAALFRHLPFVMRPTNDDLDAVERGKYCGAVIENWEGQDYYCYYIKRTKMNEGIIETTHEIVKDGVTTSVPFETTPEDLNPVPTVVNVEGVTPGTSETLSVMQPIVIDFDAQDVQYLKEVCRIRFKDEAYALVSELAICSGEDKQVPRQPVTGQAYNFLEVAACQINVHVSCYYPLEFSNEGFTLQVDMGASEPIAVDARGVGAPVVTSTTSIS